MSDLTERLRDIDHDVSLDERHDAAARIERLEAALREIGERGYVSIYTERIVLLQMLDENTSIARRALRDTP